MGYVFGKKSKEKLATAHPKLQLLMNEAIKTSPIDFVVTCGHRGKEEQNEAARTGHSKLKWPNGNHNAMPSNAVDIVPYPNYFKSTQAEWKLLNDHIRATAKRLGTIVRWGGDWDGDGDSKDERFLDIPHWELRK